MRKSFPTVLDAINYESIKFMRSHVRAVISRTVSLGRIEKFNGETQRKKVLSCATYRITLSLNNEPKEKILGIPHYVVICTEVLFVFQSVKSTNKI
jgi:hypothetical protein